MKAIILAAGYATRLYPLTLNMPKALLTIADKPIIGYILDEVNTIDEIDHAYVVTNSKFYEQFRDWANTVGGVTVLDDGTSSEQTRRGAIGDILFSIETLGIDDDLMIIAGDNFFTYRLADYYAHYCKNPADYIIVKELEEREQLKQFAVVQVDGGGRVTNLVEKPKEPQSNIAAYATYIYQRETIPMFKRYIAEGNNPDAPGHFVQWLYKLKPVYVYRMKGECYDIGTHKAYDEVKKMYERSGVQ